MADQPRNDYNVSVFWGNTTVKPEHMSKITHGEPLQPFMTKSVTPIKPRRHSLINIVLMMPELIYHYVKDLRDGTNT